MTNENETMTFHNENAISRISLWANIIGYVLLVFGLISFAYQIRGLVDQWSQVSAMFSQDSFKTIAAFTSQVFKDPLVSVFYFLVLRGVSELLNLGRDLYYGEAEMVDVEEADTE